MPDREKVIETVEEAFDMYKSEYEGTSFFDEKEWAENKRDAIELLKEQEAVVRCKDCKHYRYYGLTEDTVSECTIDHCENPDADWFCADGERKEGR